MSDNGGMLTIPYNTIISLHKASRDMRFRVYSLRAMM